MSTNLANINMPAKFNHQAASSVETGYHLAIPNLKAALDSAARVGRVALVAVDQKGHNLTEPSGVAGFCSEAHRHPDTSKACELSERFGLKQAMARSEPFTYFCPFGLMETVAPIASDGDGGYFVIISQTRCRNSPPGLVDLTSALDNAALRALADPSLKAFHEAAPDRDFNELSALASLLTITLPNLNRALEAASPIDSSLSELRLPDPKLNPSFLVSAIGSIANLSVLEKAWKTNRMVLLLSDLLKSIQSSLGSQYRSLADEINDVERYLAMQSLRYGELLSYRIDLPPSLASFKVPTDALMPAVERAVFLGLSSSSDKLQVDVSSRRTGRQIIVEVRDNLTIADRPLDQFSSSPMQSCSELRNIASRLESTRQKLSRLTDNPVSPDLVAAPDGGSIYRFVFPVVAQTRDTVYPAL